MLDETFKKRETALSALVGQLGGDTKEFEKTLDDYQKLAKNRASINRIAARISGV